MKALRIILILLLLITSSGALFAADSFQVTGLVRYKAGATLGEWSGENNTLAGGLTFSSPGGKVCVKQAFWDSKNKKRDDHTKTMFQAETRPTSCFVLKGVEGNPEGGSVTLKGSLNLNGVDRDLAIPGSITNKNGSLHFEGVADLKLSDYGITRPSMMGMQVQDLVHITIIADGKKQ